MRSLEHPWVLSDRVIIDGAALQEQVLASEDSPVLQRLRGALAEGQVHFLDLPHGVENRIGLHNGQEALADKSSASLYIFVF